MKTIHPLLLILSSLLSIDCFGKIQFSMLETIFPFLDPADLKILHQQLIAQDTLEDAKNYLNKFIDDHWIQPSETAAVKNTSPEIVRENPFKYMQDWEKPYYQDDIIAWNSEVKWKSQSLNDKEFARFKALQFLEHRHVVQVYLRHLMRRMKDFGYIKAVDAKNMRENFWKFDADCGNMFNCTNSRFLRSLSYKEYYHVLELTSSFKKFPPQQGSLDWSLGTAHEKFYYQQIETSTIISGMRLIIERMPPKSNINDISVGGHKKDKDY